MASDFLLLNPKQLRDLLPTTHLYFFEQLDSTNDFAIDAARTRTLKTPALVLAREQARGRGQREARWVSPLGNLAMTLCFKTELPLETCGPAMGRLGLETALSICQAINRSLGISGGLIKWPNDLIFTDRKVGGLLIETVPDTTGTVICMGIGINVNAPISAPLAENALPPTSLSEIRGLPVSLLDLVLSIHSELSTVVASFPNPRFPLADIVNRLWYLNQQVSVSQGTQASVGRVAGITNKGELKIWTSKNEFLVFASGTLRPFDG